MNQQSVNFFPWDDTAEDNVFPTGCFHMKVELEDGMSGTGKRMIKGRFQCKAPAEYANMSHFENYVVGTDENPNGINAGSMGARALKKMFKAAQIPPANDFNQLLLSANANGGAELLVSLNHYVEKDGQYAGTPRNRVADYHRLGEREVKVAQPKGPANMMASASQPVAAPPVAQPAPPTAPYPGPVAQPNAVMPQPVTPPVAPPAAAPSVQAPVAQNAPIPTAAPAPQPVAPPTASPQPVETQVVQPPAPVTPANAAPANEPEPVVRCVICQTNVPQSQFTAHVQAHAAG